MKQFYLALLGILFTALPSLSQAETVAAYGVSEGEGPRLGLGMEQESVGRLSALDTNTGEHTNAKYFTTRGPGSFTAMARNGAGTLYAIQEPNRLVSIDETTGIATDVATLIDSVEMTSVRCPAMAFVPGSIEELYAIIKRDMYYDDFALEEDTLPSVQTGFILVRIDVGTGQISETGIYIGGQYGNGLGHGLTYDSSLDRLIHGYYQNSPGDVIAAGSTLEIIDLGIGSVTIAQYEGEEIAYFPVEGEEVAADLNAERPGGFQGMTGLGNGNLLAYANRSNSGLFTINVWNQYAPVDEVEGASAFISSAIDSYVWTSYRVPLMNYFYGSVRAMDLTSDSQNILLASYGELYTYDMTGNPTGDPIVSTSVGGFPLYVESIATQPGSGKIFGLVRNNSKSRVKVINLQPRGVETKETGSGVGLVILDSNGPEISELDGLDVEFLTEIDEEPNFLLIEPKGLDDEGDGVNVYAISSIAFDENGNLFGWDADYRQFVRINLSTGKVTPFADFDVGLSQGGNLQLEYNPEDGNFYVLTYGYIYDKEKGGSDYELILLSISPSGNVTQIPLSGDFPNMSPNSLVFAGMGTFYCTTNNYYGPDEFILQINVNGNVTVLSGGESEQIALAIEVDQYFQTTGLALLGNIPTSDVSVGTSRSKLRGNNVYNRSGRGQSVKLSKRGKSLRADFYSKVENDGNYAGLFELRGTKGKGKNKISYFEGRKNVTASMAKGHVISLGAGKSANIKVSLSRKGSGKWVSNNRISASYGSNTDLGAVKTSLVSKNPKKNSPRKPISLF